MTAARSGHCLCGAVGISIRSPGHELGLCHCGMCRRWTGLGLLSLTVPVADMTITGAEHVRTYVSSDWATRQFCGICGSVLWYRLTLAGAPDDYYIAAGLLDDLSGMRLDHEIYIDCKPDAFAFAGPTHQQTEAEVMASINASLEE